MPLRSLAALPVFNEMKYLPEVLPEVLRHSEEVLVIDDGSTDGTTEYLARQDDIHLVMHEVNRGYGAAIRSAFEFARRAGYDVLVTIDCDGQHEPQLIPRFVEACGDVDIVSGSRYLQTFAGDSAAPAERRRINALLTAELNATLGLRLTDAFCGFKAYRVAALDKLHLTDDGYAMPLELWVQASRHGLKIRELAVPLIYLDESRSFGGSLDNAEIRLQVYREVLHRAIERADQPPPVAALAAAGGEPASGAGDPADRATPAPK